MALGACCAACQRSGIKSGSRSAGGAGKRASTSCRYAHGSTPRRWQVDVKLKSTAAVSPPRGDPTVNQFLRLCGGPHNRKIWLAVGSPGGGQTAVLLFSFTSTCQRLGVEPWAYLQDVLTRLPTMPAGELGDLLPDQWRADPAATDLIPAPAGAAGSASSPHADSSP